MTSSCLVVVQVEPAEVPGCCERVFALMLEACAGRGFQAYPRACDSKPARQPNAKLRPPMPAFLKTVRSVSLGRIL